MEFEFVSNPDLDFLTHFGRQFNIPVQDNTLIIPPQLGEGSIRKIDLDSGLKLIVHRYRLHEEFILKRRAAPQQHHELIQPDLQ